MTKMYTLTTRVEVDDDYVTSLHELRALIDRDCNRGIGYYVEVRPRYCKFEFVKEVKE